MFLDNKIFIQFLLLNSNFTQCLLDNRICTHFLKRSTAFSHFVLEQHFYNVMKQSRSCYLCALFVIIKLNSSLKLRRIDEIFLIHLVLIFWDSKEEFLNCHIQSSDEGVYPSWPGNRKVYCKSSEWNHLEKKL